MDRVRKRSVTRVKSPAGRKSNAGKSPGRPRSKSRSQQVKKDAKTRGRSKSTTKKESRSRSRVRTKSKSPKPRTRSRTRRSVSRSRAPSKSMKIESRSEPDTVESTITRKMNLVLKDVYHDDYVNNSTYKDIIKRSTSKELSVERNSSVTRRYSSLVKEDNSYPNLVREPPDYPRLIRESGDYPSLARDMNDYRGRSSGRDPSEHKESDGMSKEMPTSISNLKMPKVSEKKMGFKFSVPRWLMAAVCLLGIPPFMLLIHLGCTREQCMLTKFHIPRNLNLYFNLKSGLIVLGFVVVQALLSLLSIGRKVCGPPGINGTLMYRCNGLLSTVISVGIVTALWHYKYPVGIVYEKMISVMVSSALLAYFFGIVLFIKGGRAIVPALNPAAIGENRLYQFLIGREINPLLFGKLNMKTLLIRISLNALVIINGLMLLKDYETKHAFNHTLLTCVVLMILLVVDFFWFEDSFPSTFEAMYEGTGCYLTLSYMLFPFFPTLITKYIIQHKVQVPVYGLAAIIIIFLVGFFIYRLSNLQKAAFRRNPLNPALAHFETISTSRGKKLLISGWWGYVRHPNYLGTLVFHWAWASSAGITHAIPYVFPVTVTLLLICRAVRVDILCRDRYQSAWEEYSSRVPHRIIPRVF